MNKEAIDNFNKAKSMHQEGNIKKAQKIYKNILKIYPGSSDVLHYFGVSLFQEGHFLRALEYINKSITFKNDNAKFILNKANVLLELKRYDEAILCFKHAIFLDKYLELAYVNLGLLYIKIKKFKNGKEIFKKVFEVNSKNVEALIGLGSIYNEEGSFNEAINLYDKAIDIDPKSIEAINNRGISYQNLGNYEKALYNFNKTILIDQSYDIGYNNKGVILKSYNKINEAINCFNKAISLNSNFYEAYKNYFSIIKFNKNDPNIEKTRSFLKIPDLSQEDKFSLFITLTEIEKNFKNYSNVFKYLSKANKIKKDIINYDINFYLKVIQKRRNISFPNFHISSFKKKQFKTFPIFILGMPRSGSTLIEQIISSHSNVFGGGELPYFDEILLSFNWGNNISFDDLENIRSKYLKKLSKLSNARFITDKMPSNFHNIGLITNSIPESKIIHIHRNPMAVCWSIFYNNFHYKTMGFSFDLETIGEYYNHYNNLMKYFYTIYSNKIYSINYENFIEKQEIETKKLMSFLNLNMEKSTLEFYKNERMVQTASLSQVRKPIYKGSSNEWKNYRKWLKPLMDVLDKYNIVYE